MELELFDPRQAAEALAELLGRQRGCGVEIEMEEESWGSTD